MYHLLPNYVPYNFKNEQNIKIHYLKRSHDVQTSEDQDVQTSEDQESMIPLS